MSRGAFTRRLALTSATAAQASSATTGAKQEEDSFMRTILKQPSAGADGAKRRITLRIGHALRDWCHLREGESVTRLL